MWKHFNGGTMKLLAMIGVVLITLLFLILLNWVSDLLLEPDPNMVMKGFVTLFTLLIGGSAGAKYVSTLTVTKKGADDEHSS